MLDLAAAQRIAAAYPPEARHTPAWERERYLTETQQLAWQIRFDPERAAEVLSANRGQVRAEVGPTDHQAQFIPHNHHHHHAFAGDKA